MGYVAAFHPTLANANVGGTAAIDSTAAQNFVITLQWSAAGGAGQNVDLETGDSEYQS